MDTDINLLMQTLQQFWIDVIEFIPNLIISLIIFFVSLYMAGLISGFLYRWLTSRDTDPELALLLRKVIRWSLIIFGITMALNQVGFNLSAFLTGLGIVGFTIGFAIQDVSKNFIAGLLLLIEQPFDIGDSIEVAGFSGQVLDVDLRATELRTFDGLIVAIPNADIFTSAIVNFSKAERRRIALEIGVAYGTDLERARQITLETIDKIEGILTDPAPRVVYKYFGPSTIDMTLYYWFDTSVSDPFKAQDEGIVALDAAYTEAKIDLPYPIQIVRLEQK